MKTKEKILEDRGFLLATFNSNSIYNAVIKSMQEHTDQAIVAYKLKLKEEFEKEWIKGNLGTIPKTLLFKHIDTTTI